MSETDPQQTESETPDAPPPAPSTGRQTYDIIADKVGGVPNLRKKDNLYQGITIAATSAVGAIVGFVVDHSTMGTLIGLLGGMIVGALLSGFVLMVIGLARKP